MAKPNGRDVKDLLYWDDDNANKSSSQFPNDQTKCIKKKKKKEKVIFILRRKLLLLNLEWGSHREESCKHRLRFVSLCNKRKPENLCINLRDSSNEITFLLFFFTYIYTQQGGKKENRWANILSFSPPPTTPLLIRPSNSSTFFSQCLSVSRMFE